MYYIAIRDKLDAYYIETAVDVGTWDFAKGEPHLIDAHEAVPDELAALLKNYGRGKPRPAT